MAGVKDERVLERHSGPAVAAVPPPDHAGLERIDVVEMEARPEPGQEISDRVRARAAGDGAADHGLDVLRGVIGAPGEAIGLLPFLARHPRMVGRHMFEVELIEVGVDVDALGHRFGVVLAAGQRVRIENSRMSSGSSR